MRYSSSSARPLLAQLGAQAIAAVSMTLPIVVLLAAAAQGIGVGIASLISRHLGAREYLEASRGGSTALALTAPIGIIATGALLPNLPGIFAALGATPTIMPVALDYAGTLLFGYTLMTMDQKGRRFLACLHRRRLRLGAERRNDRPHQVLRRGDLHEPRIGRGARRIANHGKLYLITVEGCSMTNMQPPSGS
ncbi:MATE family efflux transporter [Bradyrhizobium sp. I1.7.5]|uniref:MATE family efflux transporter n=1 Tax=Bradyrhizobium sp. I1.7.5 TaxID=3156363 RepID=UPI0033933995